MRRQTESSNYEETRPLELINVKKRCVSPFILRIEPPATTAKDFLEINSIQEAKRCRLLDYPENTIVRVITEFDKENNRPREPTPPPVEGDKWEVRCVLPNGDKLNLTELCAQSTLGKDVRPLVEDSLGRTDFIFMGATVPPVAYSGEDERRPLEELDVSHRTVIKVKWVDAEHVYRP
ncbi:hypothetical protein ADEAN_000766700 [Angomonas deanei]|uniref:Uncharacterized protein n=1 Tax=Angomonas deanei TaxID=59799 RepID=A0A7G2CPN7_9TRYP|nr:hypothetical protein ADEAN_000766700 [Angomonas deanei]